MVESGSPPALIAVGPVSAVPEPEPVAPAEKPASDPAAPGGMLSLPFLVGRLQSESIQVRMWAAYHLVDRWQDQVDQYVAHMWHSPVPEIRESAINLIGKHRIHTYAFPLLRLVTSNELGLRVPAALALARLQYEPAGKALLAWFEEAIGGKDVRTNELEAAAECLLLFDRRRHWPMLFGRLDKAQNNHNVFAALFRLLCRHAVEPEEYERVAYAYGQPREVFHDFHLTQELVDMVGRGNVSRYLQTRLSGGYPLPAIYQECLRLLGIDPLDARLQQLIESMTACRNNALGVRMFVTIAAALIDRAAPGTLDTARMHGFLKGVLGWIGRWDEAILKVREVEYHMLLSLPLVVLLRQAERACLAKPEEEALRISRIYQSPLLSPEFMRQVLTLLASRGYGGDARVLGRELGGGWLWDDEKDTLWKLFTGQLEGVDYPFEQTIPQPWSYHIPGLMNRLEQALAPRLNAYLDTERNQAVDYALEVFRHASTPELIDSVLRHFAPLFNRHFGQLLEFVTHLPDRAFLEPLSAQYREGEFDLERLIRFVCDVHQLPYPANLAGHSPRRAEPGAAATVRLPCPHCNSAFQYACPDLFVNEEKIEQRQVPGGADLWTAQAFECKNCHQPIPFTPDDEFLNDVYLELLAARLVHPNQRDALGLNRIQTIPFPLIDGRTVNPSRLLEREEEALQEPVVTKAQVEYLYELGRFYMEVGMWDRAKRALRVILAGPVKFPKALYSLGVVAFQERNLYDARVFFSRLIATCSRDEFEGDLDNPVDMAQHYLKLLDKREFKRSHFQLISS